MTEEKISKKNKEASFKVIFVVMGISLLIAYLWDKANFSFLRDSISYVLNPTAGWLLSWHLEIGMLIIVLVMTLITTIIQKYATDQEQIKELKKEQKELQEEMKKYREHPEKLVEFQKKQMEFFPKMMRLTMRPLVFTGIPFILFF